MPSNETHWMHAPRARALTPVVMGVVIYIAALLLSERASLDNPEGDHSWAGIAWQQDASFQCAGASAKDVVSPRAPPPVDLPDTLMSWWDARTQLRIDCGTASIRRDALEHALSDPGDRFFANARNLLVEEHAQLAKLEQRERSLRFKDFDLWGRVGVGVPSIVFSLATVIMLIGSAEHNRNQVEWRRWLRVYSPIAVLCAS